MSLGNTSFCPEDCHPNSEGYGYCQSATGQCFCRNGWEGDSCSISYATVVGIGWNITNYIVGALFLIIGILSIIQLIRLFISNKSLKFDPLKIIHALLALEGFERFIYFTVDPYGTYDVFPRMLGDVLYGLGIAIPYSIVTVILYHRIEIYVKITSINEEGLRRRKILYPIVIGAIVGIQLIFSITPTYISSPSSLSIYNGLYYLYLLVVAFGELYVLFFYGRKAYKTISNALFSDNTKVLKQQQLKRIQLVLYSLGFQVIIIFFSLLFSFIFEELTYHFSNPYSYLVEMTEFEFLILLFCAITLSLFFSSVNVYIVSESQKSSKNESLNNRTSSGN